jgi:hypothetical protein
MDVKFIGEVVPARLNSASAVEIVGNNIFIAGDNINYLYHYNSSFRLLDKIKLFTQADFEEQPKPIKHDWEAMSTITTADITNQILIIGSGSTSYRNNAFLFNPTTKQSRVIAHWPAFYDELRNLLTPGEELNIEGLAQVGKYLVFFNRGNLTGGNCLFIADTATALKSVAEVSRINSLPFAINKTAAGYTGSYYLKELDMLLYTATAEVTTNAYDDGKVMGSAIGYFSNISKRLKDAELKPDAQFDLKDIIKGKVESLSMLRKSENSYVFLAVTDNDGAPGSLFELLLRF